MKLITAVIQPGRLDHVSQALTEAGFPGVTVTEVKGHGAQASRTEYYRGMAVSVPFRSKMRLELVVANEQVDTAVQLIVDHARTGQIGDGKVWVTAVEHVVRVRTGETGDAAV
ncbi:MULTISPECIES: P-II family nitrogen regulator [Citricoccus]|uniref:P-II family nitrogen regulator n=1 Tax=Citricoccus muralis TaxID=169134 RepID=A0ABY8H3K7_9MICC|nr:MULTISPECIES: P-II family nitrogen regulator [Citricoccus]WBL18082.1 P-II family nitrogen regulator [Citricoccus sp. NR2]WFP15536.1 P-II family nitrogen regulator [Citricoccus muralis]